ncbi:conserved hypothetical protein [Parvibaculum lavamentivorans DS-1]|uniref:Pole-organizing protein PopZ n=1 Tax=Parvibaculum lavamentivorans (strain DS-1 / DSM 13023 / NCIMB 13966) TaxID=402881 RepID=A7HXH9_PARL1|nr:DUF2497 domain-containing protein [Parvibaculum lavamentivorans]ABS64612.1 conserved hypothetical protein [Parvibaculum lavamentivorans DS-1]
MEEILASIRRIISEDSGPEEGAQASEVAAPPPAPESLYEEPAPEPEPVEDDILELTEALPEEPAAPAPTYMPEPDFNDDDIQFADPVPQPQPEPVAELEPVYQPEPEPAPAVATGIAPQPEPVAEDEPETAFEEPVMSADSAPSKASPLLSSDTESAASAAFGALANSLMTSSGGSRTLEELVGDLLRPMLKEWLDENLPSLVERLVAEEIERVARRKG